MGLELRSDTSATALVLIFLFSLFPLLRIFVSLRPLNLFLSRCQQELWCMGQDDGRRLLGRGFIPTPPVQCWRQGTLGGWVKLDWYSSRRLSCQWGPSLGIHCDLCKVSPPSHCGPKSPYLGIAFSPVVQTSAIQPTSAAPALLGSGGIGPCWMPNIAELYFLFAARQWTQNLTSIFLPCSEIPGLVHV